MAVLSPFLPFLNLTQKHTAQFPALRATYARTFARRAPAPSRPLIAVVPVRETPPLPARYIYPAVMLRQNQDEHFAHRAFAQYAAAIVALQVAASSSSPN